MKKMIMLTLVAMFAAGMWAGSEEYLVKNNQAAEGDTIAYGTVGENIEWALTKDSVLTISGEGRISGEKSYPWDKYYESILYIVIDEGVTRATSAVFSSCQELKTVSLSSTITSIPLGAFKNLKSLTAINVAEKNVRFASADGVWFTSAKDSLLCYPKGKKDKAYTIPDGVKLINDYAFANTALDTIICEAVVPPTAGKNCFNEVDKSIPVIVPCGCKSAYEKTAEWMNFTNIQEKCEVPDDEIWYWSADGNVVFPSGSFGATIANITYADGKGVIKFNGKVTKVGSCAFFDKETLRSIMLPNSVTEVEHNAFCYCSHLVSADLGDSVQLLSDGAFAYCSILSSVDLGVSLTTIQKNIFKECYALYDITLPSSVTSIGAGAFAYCTNLRRLICEAVNPPEIGESGMFVDVPETMQIVVPCGSKLSYQRAEGWNENGTIVDNCQDLIPDDEIWYTTENEEVVEIYMAADFGANVVSNTYADGKGVIKFDGEVTMIGDSAFLNCKGLLSVTIPNMVQSIGDYAFNECEDLQEIFIPKSVNRIGEFALAYCDSLKEITVDSTSYYFWSQWGVLFKGDTLIQYPIGNHRQSYSIPEGVKCIGQLSFAGCDDLVSLTMPSTTERIGGGAMINCNIDTLTSYAIAPPVLDGEVGLHSTQYVRIPCGSTTAYQEAENDWSICTFHEMCKGGICGDNATWALNQEGVLTISGTGTIYSFETMPWSEYEDEILRVVIEEGITNIPMAAFRNCSTMVSVAIPSTVQEIGFRAFDECTSLKSVYITDMEAWCRISYTYEFMFTNANPLYYAGHLYLNKEEVVDLVIPANVSSISAIAFVGCKSLESVTIHSGVTDIGLGAFYRCDNLSKVYITDLAAWCKIYFAHTHEFFDASSNPLSLAQHLYLNSAEVTNLVVPESVSTIGGCAFYNCAGLQSATMHSGVTKVGGYAFYNCGNLNSMICQGTSAPVLEGYAFYNLPTGAVLTIPCGCNESYLNSGWGVFNTVVQSGCGEGEDTKILYTTSNNTKLTLGATNVFGASILSHTYKDGVGCIQFDGHVTQIGERAFDECNTLTTITLPSSVQSIGYEAFDNCSNLRYIEFPSAVNSIAKWAFWGCISLQYITSKATNAPTLGQSCFYNVPTSIPVYIPCGSWSSYVNAGWNYFTNIQEQCEEDVPYDEIWYTSTDGKVVTPNSAGTFGATIVSNTYSDGKGVIKFNGNVGYIGANAFPYCHTLATITIPKSATYIGAYAFMLCDKLASITIPNSITKIGTSAFAYCDKLVTVRIPSSVTTIDNGPFHSCDNLQSIEVDEGSLLFTSNNGVLFNKSMSLLIQYPTGKSNTTYYIPDAVKTIGDNSFQSNTKLTTIVIPDAVTHIGMRAFGDCTSLTSIIIPCNVTQIDAFAFKGCSAINAIVSKAPVAPSIGDECFDGISKSISVTVPCGCKSAYSSWSNYFTNIQEQCEEDVTYIYYTSTDGKKVTPNKVGAFGALISSNTYSKGQGVITFSGAVTAIGDSAFLNCTTLKTIQIPNSVTYIGERALNACSGLLSVTFSNSLRSLGDNSFAGCGVLSSITIPKSVTSISSTAFWGCRSLSSISVETGNNYYDSRNGCNAIIYTSSNTLITGCDNTVIPTSVTCIGKGAFAFRTNMTSITIPYGVTSIQGDAFYSCESLSTIICNAQTAPSLGSRCFNYVPTSAKIKVPCGCKSSYTSSTWGSYFSNFVEGCGEETTYSFDGTSVTTSEVEAFYSVPLDQSKKVTAFSFYLYTNSKRTNEVCHILFNGDGQMQDVGIYMTPSRKEANDVDATTGYFTFEVSGLNTYTTYYYTLTAYVNSVELTTKKGSFTTQYNYRDQVQKVIRRGQIVIIRDGKEYDVLGGQQ